LEEVAKADEAPIASAEFEVLSMLVEAYLRAMSREERLAFLRHAAGVLAEHDTNVSNILGGASGARADRQAKAWLRRNLIVWLAMYG
jgi:hypothetical protein